MSKKLSRGSHVGTKCSVGGQSLASSSIGIAWQNFHQISQPNIKCIKSLKKYSFLHLLSQLLTFALTCRCRCCCCRGCCNLLVQPVKIFGL